MKTKIVIFGLAPVFFVLVNSSLIATAQCTNQVSNLSGISIVNGTNVNVSSSGAVDSLVYCTSGVAKPYWIGQHNGISGNGSYSFSFSPPVMAMTLNFGAISNAFGSSEEVEIYINGLHYAVQSLGNVSGCEPMAIITPAGNIGSCNNCPGTGCKDLTIVSSISNLTVSDVIISGDPAGCVFSLFICDSMETGLNNPGNADAVKVFPNPVHNNLNITTSENRLIEIIVSDLQSRILLQEKFTNSISISTEQLAKGIYLYEVRDDKGIIKKGKLVKD